MATAVGESASARAATPAAARCSFARNARTSVSATPPSWPYLVPGAHRGGAAETAGRRWMAGRWVWSPGARRWGPVTIGASMTVRQIRGSFSTVSDVLAAASDINAEVEAYVEIDEPGASDLVPVGPDGRRRLTFRQWDDAADDVAGLFTSLGVAKGDVVALLLPSSIDYAICY